MKEHLILVLAMVDLLAGTATGGTYSGGTGEPNDPYQIATPEDLNDIGNYEEDWDKHFILVNDVNLAEYTGTQFKIIGNNTTKFTGVFDGNDHKVWNFTRIGSGLFGCLRGYIRNLGMENVVVQGSTTGGLVKENDGTITNCYSKGNVSGFYYVGGLVGYNAFYGTLTNCYSTGRVTGEYAVGGLVGRNYGTITNSYSSGSVSGNEWVGGLVGWNEGKLTACYATGSVTGGSSVGGLGVCPSN